MPGPAGRKAIPDNIKVLKGTNQKCRMRKSGAKQAAGEISMPPFLISERAKMYFELLREELKLIGMNSRTYSFIAALAAGRMAEIDECEEIVARDGRVLPGQAPNFVSRTNPAVSQLSEAKRHLQSLCSELGLTPTALGRIGKAKEPEAESKGFGGL